MVFSILLYSMVTAIIGWYFNKLNASPSSEHHNTIFESFNRYVTVTVLFMIILMFISSL